MKTLYFECNMGAAGDMLMASLLELIPNQEEFIEKINHLGIPGVKVMLEKSVKCGITGSHIAVTVHGDEEESVDVPSDHDHDHHEDHEHHHEHASEHAHPHTHEHTHSGMGEIRQLIESLPVSEKVHCDALRVFGLVAEAESFVHGRPVEQIHFHEVGNMDAVADIVGVCMLMEEIAPEKICASAIHVGSGQVRCAHGILPVPAPATAYILRDVPIYGGAVRGELCTPTGAALLKYFATDFGAMPVMTVSAIGYGMGKKDFEAANCVRAYLGSTGESGDEICELRCNLDDMTPEAIGFAQEILFEHGAIDVYTIPIGMKKSRPGVMLCCMCRKEEREALAKLLLRHTTTLGVRVSSLKRYTLNREMTIQQTKYGPVRLKTSSGDGTKKIKPEYEDMAKIAKENDLTIGEVLELLQEDYR